MNLIPTHEEVMKLLEETGALRHGYFHYPNGVRSSQYLQLAMAMRYYQNAKTLSVALSRKLRQNTEIRAMIPQLSVVAPATGGLAVAYGIVEALRAAQIYWAEEDIEGQPQRFRLQPAPSLGLILRSLRLAPGAVRRPSWRYPTTAKFSRAPAAGERRRRTE